MPKVLVERPRSGSRDPNHNVRRDRARWRSVNDVDAMDKLPQHQPMRPRPQGRWLNEHLGPLRKYLNRQVGRPWNDVYSDIRACVHTRRAIDVHILEHLYDYVQRRPRIEGERVFRPPEDGRIWRSDELFDDRRTFYVDPRDGVLKRPTRRRPVRRRNKPAAPRALGPGEIALFLHNHWFAVRLAPLDDGLYRDVVLRRAVDGRDQDELSAKYGRRRVYAVAKRQLSKKDVRRWGLA